MPDLCINSGSTLSLARRRITPMLVMLALALRGAQAHGGGMHPWDWTTPGRSNLTRVQLATASNFTAYNPDQAKGYLPGAIAYFPSNASAANITGTVEVWEYLIDCEVTAALSVDLVLTTGGQPIAGEKVYLWGMTGSCAAGVQDVYRNNASLGDNQYNMLWVGEEAETEANGTLWGTAPNVFFPRRVADANGPALVSILLATNSNISTLMCADLVWNDSWNTAVWSQGIAACNASTTASPIVGQNGPPAGALSPPPPKSRGSMQLLSTAQAHVHMLCAVIMALGAAYWL